MATLNTGLYDPAYEHDACGFGFVARVDGRKTRQTVDEGLQVLHNMEHRGARGSDPETGDGAGIMLQISDDFFRREAEKLGIELAGELTATTAGRHDLRSCGEEIWTSASGSLGRRLAPRRKGQKVLGFPGRSGKHGEVR